MKKDLTAMGYREIAPRKWAKPVGYTLFIFVEETNEFQNWFAHNTTGQPMLYSSRTLTEDKEFLGWLKYQESWSKDVQTPSNFEFLTLLEQYTL